MISRKSSIAASMAVLLVACASNGGPRPGGGDGGAADAGGSCTSDTDCGDDGIFCNGTVACVGGRCVAQGIPTCNDGIGCTRDECMTATDECQNTPIRLVMPRRDGLHPGRRLRDSRRPASSTATASATESSATAPRSASMARA